MRAFASVLLTGTLGWLVWHPVTGAAQAPGRDPAPILAAAREALGGEKRLSAVKNFVATGRTRQVRGDNLVPIEFEIAVELPDKFRWLDAKMRLNPPFCSPLFLPPIGQNRDGRVYHREYESHTLHKFPVHTMKPRGCLPRSAPRGSSCPTE